MKVEKLVKYVFLWCLAILMIGLISVIFYNCHQRYENKSYETTIAIVEEKYYGGFADTRSELHIAVPANFRVKDYTISNNQIILNLEKTNEEER